MNSRTLPEKREKRKTFSEIKAVVSVSLPDRQGGKI
jgi:hypothetical protein